MIREVLILLKVEFSNVFGINKFRYTMDKSEKNRYILLAIVGFMLASMLIGYIGLYTYFYITIGLGSIVPKIMMVVASMIILLFGVLKTSKSLFDSKYIDILYTMPMRRESIAISKIIKKYIDEFLLTMGIMLPTLIVYGVMLRPTIYFYIAYMIMVVFIPIVPMMISTIVGAIILYISTRVRFKNIIQMILTIVMVIGILVLSMTSGMYLENIDIVSIKDISILVDNVMERVYPISFIFDQALFGSIWYLMLFIGTSILVAIVSSMIVILFYDKIRGGISNVYTRSDYAFTTLENKGVISTLIYREFKRYISSTIYVINTIIGPVMALMSVIGLAIIGHDVIYQYLGIDMVRVLPFVVSLMMIMTVTSSVSISMEGKYFDILKTLPIHTRDIVLSKVLLNMFLLLPFYIVIEIVLNIFVPMNLIDRLLMIIVPIVIIVFCVVAGLMFNFKIHSFDWEREEIVVKQSATVALSMLIALVVSAIGGLIAYMCPYLLANILLIVYMSALVIVSFMMYIRMTRVDLITL